MNAPELARRIQTALGLDLPPVSLTFVDELPADLPSAGVAPSACSFWREAEQGTFYASAKHHYNCPIGSMVMGFELPEEVQGRLGELVGSMCDSGYLAAEEPASIPVMKQAHAGIVYGPLADTALDPSLVLIWVSARQAMLCSEAMGAAAWTTAAVSTTGRPGCAALPIALAEGSTAMSLGCAGMRTFTEIGDDRLLITIPGTALEEFASGVEATMALNSRMNSFYEGERAKLTTVE